MSITDVTRPWSEGATDTDSESETASRYEAYAEPIEIEREEPDDLADSSMALYLRDISRVPLLTAEEEVMLAKALEAGEASHALLRSRVELSQSEVKQLEDLSRRGDQARKRLTESNLRLVVSVARKYMGRGLPLLD